MAALVAEAPPAALRRNGALVTGCGTAFKLALPASIATTTHAHVFSESLCIGADGDLYCNGGCQCGNDAGWRNCYIHVRPILLEQGR